MLFLGSQTFDKKIETIKKLLDDDKRVESSDRTNVNDCYIV